MSERIYLNNDWKFAEQFEASMTEAAYDDSTMQNVRLPHTCKETPLHYFDEHCYQMISDQWLSKSHRGRERVGRKKDITDNRWCRP